MLAAFEAACSAASKVFRRRYRLAGRRIVLRIAGSSFAERLAPALRHLEAPEDAPSDPAELSIDLWDGEETGVPCPIRHLRDVFYRSYPFGRNVLANSRDASRLGFQTHEAATILDLTTGRIVGHVGSWRRLSLFELGKPLQPLLFAWLSHHDIVLVHAGLVAREGEGVLLGGAGGSGKTTTSLVCARGGFSYLGDDYIGVPPGGDGPSRGYSLYASTWLAPQHASRFPWLEREIVRGTEHEDKWLVVLAGVDGLKLAQSARLRALALPRVAGTNDTRWRPASGAEAVLRLAPSSILQLPFISPKPSLERMTELAGEIPSYWLDLGTDLDQIPRRVAEILDDALSRPHR